MEASESDTPGAKAHCPVSVESAKADALAYLEAIASCSQTAYWMVVGVVRRLLPNVQLSPDVVP